MEVLDLLFLSIVSFLCLGVWGGGTCSVLFCLLLLCFMCLMFYDC